jgi:hypothetical protein
MKSNNIKKIITESGIKYINKLKKDFKDVVIVTHMDLDGVVSGIAMKYYFESYGFKVIDVQIIQYGDKEWSLKKSDPNKKILYCLCDFAHGKPMFTIHLDHHDRQAGAGETQSTSFRQARSNVETISQIISPKDIFPNDDILLISTVDSANYVSQNISVDQVINYLFKLDKNETASRNKMMLGLIANKLLLAFKNKPGFLEEIVMTSTPSLLNIVLNIKRIMTERGFAKIPELQKNRESYIEQMKTSPNVKNIGNIIVQYGGGMMTKPGSYDRYTPFKNNPDADFLVIAWPLGLVQATCNPFKKERELKGVNLGEIAQEVLSKWESQLKDRQIPLSTIKWISESSRDFGSESVGFTFRDFVALYGNNFKTMEDGREILTYIGKLMEKPTTELNDEELSVLDKITINAWDLIQSNSGGHKCITNISGLNYLGRSNRPPQTKYRYDSESEDTPYIKFTKMIQSEFVKVLQEKINSN